MKKCERTRKIENVISDLVSNFHYYDRKEDEDLGVGAIEEAIKTNQITAAEIVAIFERELVAGLS